MSGPLPGLPDSHMTSHDWIYENIVEAGVRFGYVPTVVKPVAGAAGHIGWHNAAVVDLLALADLAGQSYVTPLPAEAEAGNSGHEQDHVYLQEASDETLEWDTFNKASGGTESDIVIDGQTWRLHESQATAPCCHHERTAICGVHDGGGTEQIITSGLMPTALRSCRARTTRSNKSIWRISLIRLSSAPAGPVGKTIIRRAA